MAKYKVKVDGKSYDVVVTDTATGAEVMVEGKIFAVAPAVDRAPGQAAPGTPVAPRPAAPAPRPSSAAAGGPGSVTAPIPGVVTKVLVSEGESVTAGQTLLKLEAMKMENDITAPVAGTVKNVSVGDGAEVKDGQLLMVIE